jgi:hypothetical protein
MAAVARKRLTDRATVYTPDAGTTLYTVPAKTDLACAIETLTAADATGPERADLARQRRLRWDPDYDALPDDAQVVVDDYPGTWNVVARTQTPVRHHTTRERTHWECLLVEAGV